MTVRRFVVVLSIWANDRIKIINLIINLNHQQLTTALPKPKCNAKPCLAYWLDHLKLYELD
jgi:hypothetical protein